ncbi:hypothetical protein KC347_g62 [Hortaea werneckii]|nr:hypothetical protein KC347_g62 [Hortaea werneckii]
MISTEQRRFLMGISTTYQNIVKAAVNGQYEHDFFGDPDPDAGVGDKSNMRRLRAVAQHLNLQFASTIRQYGHKLAIIESDSEVAANEPELEAGYEHFAELQEHIDPSEAVNRVRRILIRSLKQLASHRCLSHRKLSKDVADRLKAVKVESALDNRLEAAKAELKRIIADMKHRPITYDPAYTAIVQNMRQEKHNAKFKTLVQKAGVDVGDRNDTGTTERYLSPDAVRYGMDTLLEPDMDRHRRKTLLTASKRTTRSEEVKYFISAITKQVIERYLLRDLANDTLSPMLVGEMSDDERARMSVILGTAEGE